MADLNDNGTNSQWKQKIRTNIMDNIALAMDPKSTEDEIAAKQMKILKDLRTGTLERKKQILHMYHTLNT